MSTRLTWGSRSRWVRPTVHPKPWIRPCRSSPLALSESGEGDIFPWSKRLKRIDYWRTVIPTKSSFSTPTEPASGGYTERWRPRWSSDLDANGWKPHSATLEAFKRVGCTVTLVYRPLSD